MTTQMMFDLMTNDLITANLIPIKISGSWLNHYFTCNKDFILSECRGRCCRGTGRTLISLCKDEESWHLQNGQKVLGGILQPSNKGKCPYQLDNGLCALHGTANKPYGCIASPFTLQRGNTLIVRHRFSRLKCHGKGLPAYITFRASLDLLFGQKEAARICGELDAGKVKITGLMARENYEKLIYLDGLKHTPEEALGYES